VATIVSGRTREATFRGLVAEFLCSRDYVAEDAVMSEPFSARDSLVTGQNTRNLDNKVDSSLANNGLKSIIHGYLQPWTCPIAMSKAGNF
jgi:hypothetical protein